MAVSKVMGIVTGYANYRDSDRILNIFTDGGLIGAAARGCRRPKSPMLSAAELFVYGEFVLYESRGRYTVNGCDIRESFYPLRQDTGRLAAGSHMLEMVNAMAAEGDRCQGLMKLLYYGLSYTAYTDARPMDMAICFTVKSLSLIGYAPAVTRCARCGRDLREQKSLGFDPEAGGAVCGSCMNGGSMAVSPLSMEALRRIMLLSPEDMKKVRLPGQARRELKRACGEYAETMLEKKLKSFCRID